MTVKITPETINYLAGSGAPLDTLIAPSTKKWLCSNFRFDLDPLPCGRVAKIDSFTWKMAVTKDECGGFRVPTIHPSKVEVPNLKVTVSMADIGPWQDP